MGTFTCGHVDDVGIVVHSKTPPSDEEWNKQLQLVANIRGARERRVLVYSFGGGPTAEQRNRMNQTLRGRQAPVALVTSSVLVRGVGLAMSWFNRGLRVFAPSELQRALEYLQLTPADQVRVVNTLKRLIAELGFPVPPDLDNLKQKRARPTLRSAP